MVQSKASRGAGRNRHRRRRRRRRPRLQADGTRYVSKRMKAKSIGNAGERHHREMLRRVWPDIKIGPPRHPTDDHSNTGAWHVQSKKRATWNIKDVVRHMDKYSVHEPWVVMYEDRDRRKVENPSGVYAILPAYDLIELLLAAEGCAEHAEHQEGQDAVQLGASDLSADAIVDLVGAHPEVDKIVLQILTRRLGSASLARARERAAHAAEPR